MLDTHFCGEFDPNEIVLSARIFFAKILNVSEDCVYIRDESNRELEDVITLKELQSPRVVIRHKVCNEHHSHDHD